MILLNTSFFFDPCIVDDAKAWLESVYLPALACASATAPDMFKVVAPSADDVVTFAIHAYFSAESSVYEWLESAPCSPFGERGLSMPTILAKVQ